MDRTQGRCCRHVRHRGSEHAAGNLRLYPAGTGLPTVSSINYAAGQTRGNNAIVSLGANADIAVRCAQASGTTHFILDINGYFDQ